MMRKQGTNIEVKKNNRNRIFRHILKCDSVSNPDIAYDLKISLPTVTQNTKELLEKGLIEELGEFESTGGRRAKAFAVAANHRFAIGLDITRNHVGLLVTNLTGEIIKYERIHLPYCQEDSYYQQVNELLEAFLDGVIEEKERILGIGISFPGIVDLDKKKISASHVLGVRELPFEKVDRFFSYPCSFFNDANAGAYAEGHHGEAPERFFYLSLSNTVGGAIFDQGELIQGKNFRCGEAGHMTIVPEGKECYCGKKGCLDAYCSAYRLSETMDNSLEDFFAALERKAEKAVQTWEQYVVYLTAAINNIHMVLDCDIILGGYVGSQIEAYLPDIRRKVAEKDTFGEAGIFVQNCKYKVGAAALGAALKVIESFIEQV